MTVYPSDKPWLKLYDEGVPHSLHPYPEHPLYEFLEKSARDYPDRPAVIFKGSGFYATDYRSSSRSSCGRDRPCCGRDTPCDAKPCDE